jgi:hypothetical protein
MRNLALCLSAFSVALSVSAFAFNILIATDGNAERRTAAASIDAAGHAGHSQPSARIQVDQEN